MEYLNIRTYECSNLRTIQLEFKRTSNIWIFEFKRTCELSNNQIFANIRTLEHLDIGEHSNIEHCKVQKIENIVEYSKFCEILNLGPRIISKQDYGVWIPDNDVISQNINIINRNKSCLGRSSKKHIIPVIFESISNACPAWAHYLRFSYNFGPFCLIKDTQRHGIQNEKDGLTIRKWTVQKAQSRRFRWSCTEMTFMWLKTIKRSLVFDRKYKMV